MKKKILFFLLVWSACNPAPKESKPEKEKEPAHIQTEIEMPEQDPKEFGFKHGQKPLWTPLKGSHQIMITLVPDDTTIEGELYRFEIENEQWKSLGEPYPVSIGKTGLAWGKGGALSDNVKRGIFKKEGDGKTPAGIFNIGAAFGNATQEEMREKGVKLSFLDVADNFYCVDDVKSEHYNKIVSTDKVKKDWTSAEEMLRKDDLYDLGIFVEHNTPVEAGDGSCIIIHIWRGEGKPTHGCTATTRENMMSLLQWLDPQKNPLLIQITKDKYPQLQTWFGLPEIN